MEQIEQMKKIHRKSNFELLRILSMLMIVMHHYMCHGGFDIENVSGINKIIIECCYWGGKVGINVFLLITGYFMIKSKPNVKKLLLLYGELFFYSVAITIVFVLLGVESFSLSAFLKAIFPFTLGRHNYMTTYIMLYCLSPYINILIKNISKLQFKRLILFLFIILSVIPTIIGIKEGWVNNAYSYLIWMVFVYIIGASIRMNLYKLKITNKLLTLISILSILCIWVMTVICGCLNNISTYYIASNVSSMPVIFCSVCIFLLFSNIRLKYNKWINMVAGATLGVYCIHDDELVRNHIWKDIFKGYLIERPLLLLLNIIATTLIVFAVGVLIDVVRKKLVEKYYLNFIDNCVMKKIAVVQERWHKK